MPNPQTGLFESHQDLVPLALIQDRHFTIVGCGSLGTVLARILARLGAHRFHLIDGERVELRHLNREVFGHEQIGQNKAAALSYQLQRINPKSRSVTTAKPFEVAHLARGKEDILVLCTSDPVLPQRTLDALHTWDAAERPLVFVMRHTRLVGGYWMADLKQGAAQVPTDLPWLVPTGREAEDARSRIATTAHLVAAVTGQAIVEAVCGRPVRLRVDLDLERLVRPDG